MGRRTGQLGEENYSEKYYSEGYPKGFSELQGELSRRIFSEEKGGRFLDVGCGPGNWIAPFSKKGAPGKETFLGIDISRDAVRIAREKGLPVKKFDGRKIPHKKGSFDKVLCNHVLEHATEPRTLLKEIHRVLKPGGELILIIPHKRAPQHKTHANFWDECGIIELVRQSGFSEIRKLPPVWKYFPFSLSLPPRLSATIGALYARIPPEEEIRISASKSVFKGALRRKKGTPK